MMQFKNLKNGLVFFLLFFALEGCKKDAPQRKPRPPKPLIVVPPIEPRPEPEEIRNTFNQDLYFKKPEWEYPEWTGIGHTYGIADTIFYDLPGIWLGFGAMSSPSLMRLDNRRAAHNLIGDHYQFGFVAANSKDSIYESSMLNSYFLIKKLDENNQLLAGEEPLRINLDTTNFISRYPKNRAKEKIGKFSISVRCYDDLYYYCVNPTDFACDVNNLIQPNGKPIYAFADMSKMVDYPYIFIGFSRTYFEPELKYYLEFVYVRADGKELKRGILVQNKGYYQVHLDEFGYAHSTDHSYYFGDLSDFSYVKFLGYIWPLNKKK